MRKLSRPKLIRPFVLLLLCFGALPVLHAQLIKGSVTGNDGLLPGATIRTADAKRSVFTDLSGSFTLPVQTIGKLTLLISYVGYETKEVVLQVKPGINNIGILTLVPSGGRLGNIIIKGTMASSQARAYSIKKNAVAIMDVIAADAIGKLPDRNAAEAVQRVQGVAVSRYHGEADQATLRGTPFTWTSTSFNGNHLPSANGTGARSSVLDVVPSELIQYVQVVKALTPDMEGDAIGGSLNFITRTAPAKRLFNVSLAGGYNTFSQDGTYNGSLVYGDRFFHNKLGVIAAAAIWDRKWGTDSYEVAYNTGLANPVQRKSISTLDIKRYLGERQTYGGNIGLEYNFNSRNKVYARGMMNKFNDIRPVYESWLDFNNSRYQYTYRYSYYETKLNGLEVGGEHQVSNRLKLDWMATDYLSSFVLNTPNTNNNKGLPIAYFRQKLTSGFGQLSSDGKKYLKFDAPDGVGDPSLGIQPHLKDPTEGMNPAKLTLQQLVLAQLNNTDKDKTIQGNLKYTVNNRLTLKAGGKFRHKLRDGVNQASVVYLPGAALGIPNSPPLVTLSSLQTTAFPLHGGLFKEIGSPYNKEIVNPITKQQLYDLFAPSFLQKNGFGDYSPASNATLIYEGKEDVTAGYAMAEYNVTDKLTLIAGLRDEDTRLQIQSARLSTGTGGTTITPVTVHNNYNALLPMVHAKYSLDNNSILRAAYTRTFIRPNFTDLSPGESDNASTNPITITKGNPGLKPTFSDNFDLMGEYYFNNVGLLSGGVFYKHLTDIIFSDMAYSVDAGNNNVLTTQSKNLQKASLIGFEAGISKRLDFLKGFFSGLGVEFNYTYVHSTVNVPRLSGTTVIIDKTTLPNQSKDLFNAALFYERKGVSVRLAGNYRGKSIETLSQQLGPDLYTYSDNYFTIDASASVAVNSRLRVFAEVNNLNNAPLKYYLGDPRRPTQVEWYRQRGQAGIHWNIIK